MVTLYNLTRKTRGNLDYFGDIKKMKNSLRVELLSSNAAIYYIKHLDSHCIFTTVLGTIALVAGTAVGTVPGTAVGTVPGTAVGTVARIAGERKTVSAAAGAVGWTVQMLQGTTDSETMPMLIAGALASAISTVCEDVRECVVYNYSNHGTHLNYTFYMLCFCFPFSMPSSENGC